MSKKFKYDNMICNILYGNMIKQNYIYSAQKGLNDTLLHLQITKGGFTQAADVLSSGRVKNNCHARNVTSYSSTSYLD